MVYVYEYNEKGHNYLINNINKHFGLGYGYNNMIIKSMETLIGGYFANKRLMYQLNHIFAEKRGWEWPIGYIISKKLYKIIISDRVFKLGNISINKYRYLRTRKLVGVFQKTEKMMDLEEKCSLFFCLPDN